MYDSPVKVHHLWNSDTVYSSEAGNNGVITFVSQMIAPGTYAYGMSLCMPGDQFEKSTGRKLAQSRLDDYCSAAEYKYASAFVYHGQRRYVDIKLMMLISALGDLRDTLPEWVVQTLRHEIAYIYEETFISN